MSKYTDFYPSKVGSSFPYTGSAHITGSLAVTGSADFSYAVAGGGTVGGGWSAGGNMIIARSALGGAGTQAAALAFGGYDPIVTNSTEEYNGVAQTWSPAPSNMIIARRESAGAGTQTAALAFGGRTPVSTNATEEYNGAAWSAAPTNMIGGRWSLGGAGTQTAGLAFGGRNPVTQNATEEYNSGTWSAAPANMIIARRGIGGAGTQAAALAFGGENPSLVNATEEYNGAGWSTGGNMSIARVYVAGAGTQAAALAFAGFSTTPATEEYNGVAQTWSAAPANMIGGRFKLGGVGTQTVALGFGGQLGGQLSNSTEEWGATAGPSSFTNGFNFSNSTGITTVKALVQTSAAKLKHNIEPLGSQMNKINSLRPVRYNWKNRSTPEEIGFIAEEVQKIYPELVGKDSNGKISGINYAKMVSVLVKSVQEQQNEIDSLNNELDNLIK